MVKDNPDQHLIQRNGYWYFQRRIAGSPKIFKKALRTKLRKEARQLRDELVRKMDEQASKVLTAKSTLEIRKQYIRSLDDEEREYIEDQIQEKADDLAYELGVYDQLHDPSPAEDLSPNAKKATDFYKENLGKLHILEKWLPEWLSTLDNNKTKNDYGRGARALIKYFPVAEDINREKAGRFLRTIGSRENVHKDSVQKWRSGILNLWRYLELDETIWKDHPIPDNKAKEKPPEKEPWTKDEVRLLYETAVERNHWLKNPIWIAVHTGARKSAIAKLKYNRDEQTISFPKMKSEPRARTIPAHPEIITHLNSWEQNRKSSSSIGNQFTLLKYSLGYGEEKNFHSFRRSFITEIENLETPENIAADIVGHKKMTMGYGLYSGGASIATMKKWVEKVSFS